MDLLTSQRQDNKYVRFLKLEELQQDVTLLELALSVFKTGLALLPNVYNDALLKILGNYICLQTKAIHKKIGSTS